MAFQEGAVRNCQIGFSQSGQSALLARPIQYSPLWNAVGADVIAAGTGGLFSETWGYSRGLRTIICHSIADGAGYFSVSKRSDLAGTTGDLS